MKVQILYATSTGTAEAAANAMYDLFKTKGSVDIDEFADVAAGDLDPSDFLVVSTATYGDGELPAPGAEYIEELLADAPDLSELRYAIFGVGDSIYPETYNLGSEKVDAALSKLGATRIGEIAKFDNSGTVAVSTAAKEWAATIVDQV